MIVTFSPFLPGENAQQWRYNPPRYKYSYDMR